MNNKNQIKNRHKGRGNSWLKIDKDSNVYQKVVSILSLHKDSNLASYFEKAGFGWIRFSKVNKDSSGRYEIRYRGSKLDHPDCTISLSLEEISSFELLGNTPVKLYLETDKIKKEAIKKEKKSSSKSQRKSNDIKTNISDLKKVIQSVSNIKPEVSSQKELDEWNKWCRLNGIYNEEKEF